MICASPRFTSILIARGKRRYASRGACRSRLMPTAKGARRSALFPRARPPRHPGAIDESGLAIFRDRFLDLPDQVLRRLFKIERLSVRLLRLQSRVPVNLEPVAFGIETIDADRITMGKDDIDSDAVFLEAPVKAEHVFERVAAEGDLLHYARIAAHVAPAAQQEFMMLFVRPRAHENHPELRILVADREAEDVAVESFFLFKIVDVKPDVPEFVDRWRIHRAPPAFSVVAWRAARSDCRPRNSATARAMRPRGCAARRYPRSPSRQDLQPRAACFPRRSPARSHRPLPSAYSPSNRPGLHKDRRSSRRCFRCAAPARLSALPS